MEIVQAQMWCKFKKILKNLIGLNLLGYCIFLLKLCEYIFQRRPQKPHPLSLPIDMDLAHIDLSFSRKCAFQNSLAFEMERVVDYQCPTKR